MYAVEVSDHIMIAHSFKGEVFGPAQALHGATFTVAVAFMSEKLDANGIVVDIGCAIDVLKATLKQVNYKNLDDIAAFKGVNTTTEWLTRWVFDQFAAAVKADKLGRAPRGTSPRCASRSASRRMRAPGTRRRFGERRFRLSRCRAISIPRPAAMPTTSA